MPHTRSFLGRRMAKPVSLLSLGVFLCVIVLAHAAVGHRRTLRATFKPAAASVPAAAAAAAAATPRQVYPDAAPGFTGTYDDLGPGSDPNPPFLYDYFDSQDYQRIEGPGSLGRTLGRLVGRINRRANQTPRISSAADASTFAFGTTTAEQRNTSVAVQNGPLRTAGFGAGGAVAIDPNFAFSAANTGAASVAKRIVNDMGDNSKDFGGASTSRGFSAATSSDANLNASTSTSVESFTLAGEQAIQALAPLPTSSVFLTQFASGQRDGASGRGFATSTGAGDTSSTRLQTASLGASNSRTADINGDGGPVTIGTSILRSAADTVDSPFVSASNYSTFNTQAALNVGGNVDRYGYSRGIDSGSTTAVSTDKGRARTYGGSAGTGFATSLASASSTTYLPCTTGDNSCGDYNSDEGSDGSSGSDPSPSSSTDDAPADAAIAAMTGQ